MPREAGRVAGGAGVKAGPERLAVGSGAAGSIGGCRGERGHAIHIRLFGRGDVVGEAGRGEDTADHALVVAAAGEGDDGHAHPEGMARHGVAGAGVAVKHHIDVSQEGEVVGEADAAAKLDPGGRDAHRLEPPAEVGVAIRADHQEPGVGEFAQQPGPPLQQPAVELGADVEAAEDHGLPARAGERLPPGGS